MDARLLLLAIPTAVILGLLVAHSALVLPRRRAVLFWCCAAAYGLLRHLALRWVTAHGLGASFPYVIHRPLFPVLGVPLQEIAGWAIVAYLGWWLGARLAARGAEDRPPLFAQVAWACLFLAAIAWAVETAAVAAGWWHWSVPVSRILITVPVVGLVDWFCVGTDFLLPFAALTAPALRRRPARYLALLPFPIHFAAHCLVERPGAALPIPPYHLVHWGLLATVVWMAARSGPIDPAFPAAADRRVRWLPIAGLAIVLADAAAVDLLLARRADLLPSLLPAIAAALQPFVPAAAVGLGAAGIVLGFWFPAAMLAAVPAAAARLLVWIARGRHRPAAAVTLLAVAAWGAHAASAARERALATRLDQAMAARDRGDLGEARRSLEAACRDFPGSHVPPALLGEILYRTGEIGRARPLFETAVAIRQDYVSGFRHLAVIDLRSGRNESAARAARQGLERIPGDAELQYLQARATGATLEPLLARLDGEAAADPARAVAALAYEVDDAAGAEAVIDRAIVRWPRERWFYSTRVRLALAGGDATTARAVAAAWIEALPADDEARAVLARIEAGGGR